MRGTREELPGERLGRYGDQVGPTAHPRGVRAALAVAFGVCLLFGTWIVVVTVGHRTPFTNVRWQAFFGGYLLALAAVAAVGWWRRSATIAALGALSGAAAGVGFISIFSVGLLVILAAVPLWLVTIRAVRQPQRESVALLCGGLAFLVLLIGLMTLYHR